MALPPSKDAAPVAPTLPEGVKFVINASTIRPMLVTAASLIGFAAAFTTAILGFVNTRDLAGAVRFLQREDTLTGLTALGGAAWYCFRILRARTKKIRDVEIADKSPIAILSTQIGSSPLRAPEPETAPLNLRGIDAILWDERECVMESGPLGIGDAIAPSSKPAGEVSARITQASLIPSVWPPVPHRQAPFVNPVAPPSTANEAPPPPPTGN